MKLSLDEQESLRANLSAQIVAMIFDEIKKYSSTSQKKWWIQFQLNGQTFKEIASDIRFRVVYMWNIHPHNSKDYDIRWSGPNEIEIERKTKI